MTDSKNNTGSDNSGYFNSGDHNSGNHNSGHFNSGHFNSGYFNSGDCNSGNHNSGYHNSGHYNSGDYNSGNCNSGHRNSGHFNTTTPKLRMFNKDTNLEYSDVSVPYIDIQLSKLIDEKDMTDKEKEENPNYKNTKGYVKTLTYKEAWVKAWGELDNETKQKFLNLPNFDAEIFKEITGVDVGVTEKESLIPDTITIGGKTFKLVEV